MLHSNSHGPWLLYAAATFCGYLLIVQVLRFRRVDQLARTYGYQRREKWGKMTIEDAFQIQLALGQLEFPQVFAVALFFALFKTYGIPSISRVLNRTGELTNRASASKRAADTGVLLADIVLNSPSSDRALLALARMNQLHASYRKANLISNDDMLYTLSLFALEPSRWVKIYEWRQLSDLELCAIGTYWKSLGDAMGIKYDLLPSAKLGWSDGLNWLSEIEDWSLRYEESHMMPAETNRRIADHSIEILLWDVPKILLPFAHEVIANLMGKRLREAMLFKEPSRSTSYFVKTFFGARRFIIRHFCLPRPYFRRVLHNSEHADARTGRHFKVKYRSHPWYVRATISSRWNGKAWRRWLAGSPIPGDDGEKYFPQGYHIHEVGPKPLKTVEDLRVDEVVEEFTQRKYGGCPFG